VAEGDIKAHRASPFTQFYYGFGSISVGIKNNLLGTFLLIYYNQALGLEAMTAAYAMAIALVFDAVSDPLIGIWSDRTNSRLGRRHPFMYFSIIPFALAYYFILIDPGDISKDDLFYRLVFWLIVLRMSMTLFEVPRGALAPELSKDYDQRNRLASLGMMFGWIGGAGIDFIARRYWLTSFVDIGGYQILAFWGGVGIFIGAAVSCIGTHRNIPDLYKPPPPLVIEDSFYQESIFNKRLEFKFPLPILKNLKPIDILIYLIKVIGYLVFIWWLGNVIRILAYISAWILPKFLIRVIQVVEHFVIHAFLQSKETLNNRSWIVLFVSGVFYALLIGLESGVGTYYNEFFWQWSPAVIAPMSLITVFAVIFLVFFAPFIAKGRSKKNIAVGIFIFTIFVGPMPPFLRLMDVYFGTNIIPINGSDALWYLLATHGALMGALGALGFVFIGSMSMDIVEQVEKSTDRREEGLLGTINSFIHKLVGAGGVLVSGVIISIAGFDNPSATTADLYGGAVINNFVIIHLVIGATLPFISTLLVLMYDIDRTKHNTHVSDLGYVDEE
jgi:Na+/melibiose symporter-like transporter|tara:strand:+ start:29 stop:1699 length:1671 start_codon:yes stop_codon:yes gene_type:complete